MAPLPPSSDLLEFVDDQCIEGGQGEDGQKPLQDHEDCHDGYSDDDDDDDNEHSSRT